jgi:hypothetical protein
MSDTGKEPISFLCLRNATHNYMGASLHINKIMQVQSYIVLMLSPFKPENRQTDIQNLLSCLTENTLGIFVQDETETPVQRKQSRFVSRIMFENHKYFGFCKCRVF